MNDIHRIFVEFKQLVGEGFWLKRVAALNAEMRGNKLLKEHIENEYAVVYGLAELSRIEKKYGRLPASFSSDDWWVLYPSITLATQITSLANQLDSQSSKKLIGRVRGALKNPDDMRGLQLEFIAATHFSLRGNSVSLPEIDGIGEGDVFVADVGPQGLAIECKSISSDKGRRIHTLDAINFYNLVAGEIPISFRNTFSIGVSAVVTIDGKMPNGFKDRKQLAICVAQSIMNNKDAEVLDATISIKNFDPLSADLNSPQSRQLARDGIDEITGTNNRQAMVLGTMASGTVICTIQSRSDDNLLTSIFDTLADSAERQLSQDRAGMFIVGLNGITAESFADLATRDQNSTENVSALRASVSQFLASERRDHIIGVNFISQGTMYFQDSGLVSGGATAYYFTKPESAFWDDDFKNLTASNID